MVNLLECSVVNSCSVTTYFDNIREETSDRPKSNLFCMQNSICFVENDPNRFPAYNAWLY